MPKGKQCSEYIDVVAFEHFLTCQNLHVDMIVQFLIPIHIETIIHAASHQNYSLHVSKPNVQNN